MDWSGRPGRIHPCPSGINRVSQSGTPRRPARLPTKGGFLLVGQARWFVDGNAIGKDQDLADGDIVAYPSVPGGRRLHHRGPISGW